jgi:hypothetical protein
VYQVLMGLEREEVEARMAERSRQDSQFLRNISPENDPACLNYS